MTNWTVSRVFVCSAAHPLCEWDVKIVSCFFEISADRTGSVPWNCWGWFVQIYSEWVSLCGPARWQQNPALCAVRCAVRCVLCAVRCAWADMELPGCPMAARCPWETLEAWLEQSPPFVVLTHLWKQFEAIISTCSCFMWLHVSNSHFILSVLSPTFPLTSTSPSVAVTPWVCLSTACPSPVLCAVEHVCVCVCAHTYVYIKTMGCDGSCFSRTLNRICSVQKGNIWL